MFNYFTIWKKVNQLKNKNSIMNYHNNYYLSPASFLMIPINSSNSFISNLKGLKIMKGISQYFPVINILVETSKG